MAGRSKAPLQAAYLIVGKDELKSRAAQTRLKARLDGGLADFNLDERSASSDLTPGELLASLNTMPMGDGPRIVLISNAEKLPKASSEAIISYLADPNEGVTLCLVAETLAKSTRLYKAVAKVGSKTVIDCAPQKRWELPKTVQKMAQARGMAMDQVAAQELISRVGESTVMLDTQVKTLSSLCRETGAITRADVETHVARTAEVKPWDFLDAVCDRDAARAVSLYKLMQKPSQIALLSLLVGRIRELICARSLDARGAASSLGEALGKRDWQIKNHVRWARRFDEGDLEHALARAARCERALKSGADPDTVFLAFVLAVCGVAA